MEESELIDVNWTMLQVLGFALADLEGIMPDYDPSGDREHPGWQTIKDIKAVIAEAKDNKLAFCDDCGSTGISFSKAYK